MKSFINSNNEKINVIDEKFNNPDATGTCRKEPVMSSVKKYLKRYLELYKEASYNCDRVAFTEDALEFWFTKFEAMKNLSLQYDMAEKTVISHIYSKLFDLYYEYEPEVAEMASVE